LVSKLANWSSSGLRTLDFVMIWSPLAQNLETSLWKMAATWTTPSVYPASLSPGDEQASENIVPNLHRSSSVPPRPPRSPLRERVKSLEWMPPSPSVSESSSPQSPAHFLRRKPIPDVRLDFAILVRVSLLPHAPLASSPKLGNSILCS
jgi:hypothetical protein